MPALSLSSSRSLPVVSGRPRTPAHQMAEDNAALVWYVLRRRFPSLLTSDTRQQEAYGAGYVALVEAAARFDPAYGVTFASYALPCITGQVLRFLRNGRAQNRVPCVSLETPIGDEGRELADVVADTQAKVPGAALAERDEVERMLSVLPERVRKKARARQAWKTLGGR